MPVSFHFFFVKDKILTKAEKTPLTGREKAALYRERKGSGGGGDVHPVSEE